MKKRQNKETNIILLAYFISYGYIILALIILLFLKAFNVSKNTMVYVFFSMFFLYGIYYLVGYLFKFKHLYCALQNAYHQKMTPAHSKKFTKEMKKDCIFIGCFFSISCLIAILLTYLGII